jgi:hypothetical protein
VGAGDAGRQTAKHMDSQRQKYSIWIEAEEWADGEWTPADDNTDVTVTFGNSKRWVATFFSYQNILSLAEENRESGECLGGKYFVASKMVLVDVVSRERIEAVVAEMLKLNDFERYFAIWEDSSDVAV